MKTVYAILSFHAHEPLWDLPRRLQRTASDRRIQAGVTPDSYVRRRMREGRNVYRDLLDLVDRLGAPVSLDMTNELWTQLRSWAPATVTALGRALADGRIEPVYTAAHHAHTVLLTEEELADELRLNVELYESLLSYRRPARAGVFFTECSVDGRAIRVAEALGFSHVYVPDLDPARAVYAVTPQESDVRFLPFRLGTGHLVGLPRHFPISQSIWLPITRRAPDRVKYQGFLLGDGPVFAEDYRAARPTPAASAGEGAGDPAGPEAIAEYAAVWRSAVDECPDGGLLLYLQDLELMDFGEAALRVLGGALRAIREELRARRAGEGGVDLRLVTPAQYLAEAAPDPRALPVVKLRAASWAPELRPAMRYDGHYPPRGAGRYRGVDADAEIFRRRPFVFWEPGRFTADLFGWLLDRFGYPRRLATDALTLADEEYQIDRFPQRVRLPALYRLMKRACNWGWYPEEGMSKRTFLDGYLICDALLLDLRLRRTAPALDAGAAPSPTALPGLARLPEILVDSRLEYLRFGLERWRDERGADPEPALDEVASAREQRQLAVEAAASVLLSYRRLRARPRLAAWRDLLMQIRAYCRAMFVSLDHIQRAWGKADAEFLIVPMYRFLADVFPPRGPAILDQVDAEAAHADSAVRDDDEAGTELLLADGASLPRV